MLLDAESSDKKRPNLATTNPRVITVMLDLTQASNVRSAAKNTLGSEVVIMIGFSLRS